MGIVKYSVAPVNVIDEQAEAINEEDNTEVPAWVTKANTKEVVEGELEENDSKE